MTRANDIENIYFIYTKKGIYISSNFINHTMLQAFDMKENR